MKRILLSLCLLATACSSGLKIDKDAVRQAVRTQMASYPESHLADLYKSFFQDRFGPGHIIKDRESARDYIVSEQERSDTLLLPYFVACSWEHNYVRVSLAAVRDGLVTIDGLTDSLVQSAEPVNNEDLEAWKVEWEEILDVICAECPDFHHSSAYEKSYHPHYRVIKKDLADSIMAAHNL